MSSTLFIFKIISYEIFKINSATYACDVNIWQRNG
jgi:hypothetical protein